MFKISQRRYLGNKNSILPFIDNIIKNEIGNFNSFCDIFSGTGVVGNYFNTKDNNIISNDLLYHNFISLNAFLNPNIFNQNKLLNIINDFNNLNIQEENYFSIHFGDRYFSKQNAIKIGFIREEIRNNTYNHNTFKDLFKSKINGSTNHFKNLYLKYLFEDKVSITKSNYISNYKTLIKFTREGTDEEFNNRFFDLIYSSRVLNNLEDYYQLNKYYLYLTGIFEFTSDKIFITETVNIILKNTKFETILNQISTEKVSINLLNYLLEDREVKQKLFALGISSVDEIKTYKHNQNKDKLESLLNSKFTKENITKKILPLFKPRKDKEIFNLVSEYATVPTIFEYVIAIAWYYIDNKNIDFILNAGLSLDSNMLPKSHAVGGSSDFEIKYLDHTLMIEVTLTESTNQRRAEMESVSRHLGNILLNISNEEKRKKTYGIFIATFLNKNVLNDFRLRRLSYWENETNYIKGMNIIPFDTDDVICILKSNKIYDELKVDFYDLINVEEDRGSLWYSNHIKPYLKNILIKDK